MVGAQYRDIVAAPDRGIEVAEEILQRAVQVQDVVVRGGRPLLFFQGRYQKLPVD